MTPIDVSFSPPPPPYSPPGQHRQSGDNVTSTWGSASPGALPSYNATSNTAIEATSGYRHSAPRPRPLSMIQLTQPGSSRQMSLPLPPPPQPHHQGGSSSRAPSQNRSDTHRGHYHSPSSFGRTSSPLITVSHNDQGVQYSSSTGHGHQAAFTWTDASIRPPSSRRAVSAGAVVGSASSSRDTSQPRRRSPPMRGWEPGMPLPPPPPGPPPGARSRSVSGLPDTSSRQTSQAPTRRSRPPPVLGTGLDSIPPTPAGWVDEGSAEGSRKLDKQPLYIDTATASPNVPSVLDSNDFSTASQRPPSGGLFRTSAVRDTSAKGIRERRIERRNRQSQGSVDFRAGPSSGPHATEQVTPSDLVLPGLDNTPDNTRYLTSTKCTPHSSHSVVSDKQQAPSRPRASSTGLFSNRSPLSTPRPGPSPIALSSGYAQTPPFSPNGERPFSALSKEMSNSLPPKTLPTPPPNSAQGSRPASRFAAREDRQTSQALHLPNDAASPDSAPLQLGISVQGTSSLESVVDTGTEFLESAVQRHKVFIEKEAGAANESEAIKIFSEFIVSESQIRRERYANVWDSCSLDLDEIRRELFEMPSKSTLELEASQITPVPFPTRPSMEKTVLETSQSRVESPWWNNYKPSLSPIASLNTSNDEMSSRGRAPSRWWESKTGSSSEGAARRVQRSQRELKYMGLPREQREAMQWGQGQVLPRMEEESYASGSITGPVTYGPDQYPPEKVGWHEEEPAYQNAVGAQKSMKTERLDISRFITLPPPYPRHHPAVNNSHPDLVAYRTTVRWISDLSEIKATRQRHRLQVERLQEEHQERIQEARRQFKSNIHSQIAQGSITFAEAAEAEAAMTVEEHKLDRELAQQELDTYQGSVLKPMHAVLVDRIARATSCIDELSSKLFDDAQHETPDQTQEEGDEKPELLEKLTQLKWLFEAREQLHREIYDLMSDRNEKYRMVVLLPYKQNANEEKMRETDAFFLQDALNRRAEYEANALARLESFLDVIEGNVVRGVEIQLSAFWDIAPSLLTLIQQIPDDLRGFQVQISANEYEENPSYHQHPLQYLYSLLSHAEKSTYQYIESQTNLLCLLHEVKSAVMRANSKMMEAERTRQGEPDDVVRREMQDPRAEEERLLTADLKDRVSTIEGQWTEALGSQIQALRERVKEQLIAESGWDDMEHLEQA